MKVLIAWDVFSGCAWYRCVLPGHAAYEAGHEVRLRQAQMTRDDVEWCDTLVIQRAWHPQSLEAVKEAKRLGKLTVYDLDDDLWDIGPANSSHEFWADHHHLASEIIATCDRVTTTQPYLADTLRDHNPDVRVVPNALPTDWRRVSRPHRGLVIGWAGSNSHSEDIESIAPVITDILDRTQGVTFEIAGADAMWIDHPKVRYLPTVNIEDYHGLISRFDIGIAPLEDTHFNRSKSDLKPLEYAGCGVPCVASRVGPYKDTPALLARNAAEWRQHLTRLIVEPGYRAKVAARMQRWARTTNDTLPLWIEAWTR